MSERIPEQMQIIFRGEAVNGGYLCRFDDKQVRFTCTELEVIVELLIARLSSANGLTQLPSVDDRDKTRKYVTVHRVRQAIDREVGKGQGRRLICNGPRSTYFLNVPGEAIVIDAQVVELAPHHLPGETIARLLRASLQSVSQT